MKNHLFIKILAVIGTVLAWFPILATLLTAIIGSIMNQGLLFDFLMPAELSLFAILGGGMLVWAAIRTQTSVKAIAGTAALMLIMLIGGQAIAVFTGLASGERSMTNWVFYLVVGMLILYTFFLVILAVLGLGLCRQVFNSTAE